MNEELKNKEILQIKSDRVFRDMFNEKEMETLEWVVMQILGVKYEDIHGKVKVKNNALINTYPEERNKIVDLLVNYEGTDILIELNNNFGGNYMRNLLYAFNIVLNHYNKCMSNYQIRKLKTKVILVNLNWYQEKRYGSNQEKKQEYVLLYPDDNIDDYLLKIVNINLDLYEKICYHSLEESDKLWKLLTINEEEQLNVITQNEALLNRYRKKILNLSSNEVYKKMIMNEDIFRNATWEQDFSHVYDEAFEKGISDGLKKGIAEGIAQGIEQGIGQGIERGLAQGALNKQKEMIINMHNMNIPIDVIAECSKMSIDEVKNIINDN